MVNRWWLVLAWLPLAAMLAGHGGAADAAQPRGTPARTEKTPDLQQAVQMIVQRTNQFRRQQNRPLVQTNFRLMQTAQEFADFMARTGKYSHTADGRQPAQRAKAQGYDYCAIAENIAYQYRGSGFTTEELARGFVKGWQDSPGHRKNMLDPAVTETGVALARSGQTGYYYAVQLFARPRSKMTEFQLANRSDAAIRYTIGGRALPLPPRNIRIHRQCRPVELTFQWPGKQNSTTIQPDDGARYTIVRRGAGGFEVVSSP